MWQRVTRQTRSRQSSTDSLGRLGETIALRYLSKRGMQVIRRNWRCRQGEIDLVLCENGVLVFVEVKTRIGRPRNDQRLLSPSVLDNVTLAKQRKLRLLAEIYCSVYYRGTRRYGRFPPVRIDVVGVVLDPKSYAPQQIQHIRAAV